MKNLDQGVFIGAPAWAEWAFIDHMGGGWLTDKKPRLGASKIDDGKCFYHLGAVESVCIGGFDASNWQKSLIQRDRSACGSCPQRGDGVCCGVVV